MRFTYFVNSRKKGWNDLTVKQQSNAASMEAALLQLQQTNPKKTTVSITLDGNLLTVCGTTTNDPYDWGRTE